MPAWMAGIQVPRMPPETSMLALIPALHAGRTQSRRALVVRLSFTDVNYSGYDCQQIHVIKTHHRNGDTRNDF